MLAVFLGLRVIAGEIDGRSLEIAYTVPGGCERVWWTKLAGACMVLVVAEALLAIPVWLFFTGPFPLVALYGALQAAIFYMVLALALATLFRSEVAGAMATAAVFGAQRPGDRLRREPGAHFAVLEPTCRANSGWRPSCSRPPCRIASAFL